MSAHVSWMLTSTADRKVGSRAALCIAFPNIEIRHFFNIHHGGVLESETNAT